MITLQTHCVLSQKQSSRSLVCSWPIQVLCRADFWQASSVSSPSPSSSLESFLQSCVVSSESFLAGCCRQKQLSPTECSLSTSSLSQRSSRKFLAGLIRVATDSVVASPIERSTENTELACRIHSDMAAVPEAVESFATSNSTMRFAVEGFADSNYAALLAGKEDEGDGALMPYAVEMSTNVCLQPLLPHASSLPFSKQDAFSSAPYNELCILKQEKLRRKKISEVNKNKVPWNKGMKYKKGKPGNLAAATNINSLVLDDSVEIIAKEKQRRQRIAAANIGRTAWNKGRQHSEETRRRIKERTLEAMKNPKIRERLRAHGYTQSHETKSKISAGLVLMWEARKKLKQEQDNCEEEWKEYVADVARMGNGGKDEYDWSCHDTIFRDLKEGSRSNRKRRRIKGPRQPTVQNNCEEEWKEYVADVARMGRGGEDEYDWSTYETILRNLKRGLRSNCKRRRIKVPRQPMTSTHRIKIANAIRAKWADLSYRRLVEAAIQARWENQGKGLVGSTRRLGTQKSMIKEKLLDIVTKCRSLESNESDDDYAESDNDSVPNAESMAGMGPEFLQSMPKVLPAYRNPLNNQMLENLKRIRAQRRSKETSQSNTLERARILMAEAHMAVIALEAQTATDESALPLLQEARQLLAEAAESFKAAGLAADMS